MSHLAVTAELLKRVWNSVTEPDYEARIHINTYIHTHKPPGLAPHFLFLKVLMQSIRRAIFKPDRQHPAEEDESRLVRYDQKAHIPLKRDE